MTPQKARFENGKEASVIRKNSALHVLFIFMMICGTAAIQAQEPTSTDSPNAQQSTFKGGGGTGDNLLQHRNRRYQLHSADVLELNFPFTPEFNQTVTVQPDGYVTLRGIDNLRVQGQTLPEVTNSLKAVYGKILHDPVVNVELKDFEKPFFVVGGEVGRPGKFDLRGETTATEAVAIAGGLKESSKHSEVLLFHRVPDGWQQARKLNMKKMLKQGNLEEDAYLQPGDFLYVPKNTMSKIGRFIPTSSLGLYADPAKLP